MLPEQLNPFPVYPALHEHVKLPGMFEHSAIELHPPLFASHSLTSGKTPDSYTFSAADFNFVSFKDYTIETSYASHENNSFLKTTVVQTLCLHNSVLKDMHSSYHVLLSL